MPAAIQSCLNCGAPPETGSPMGLCSCCLMERLFDAPGTDATDDDVRVDGRSPEFITVRELASGGMGDVMEVRDHSLKRNIAMKVMREDTHGSVSARQRFRREATVLARLEHPNIVPVHEQGVDAEGRPFYTMKLVKGRTLREILDGLKTGKINAFLDWNLDALLNVFRKVGDAIAFAHSRGIVHRDLKPDNVMVGKFGEVLVMDWGLVKFLDDTEGEAECETIIEEPGIGPGNLPIRDSNLTMDGSVLGTPQFMSPEQASGRVSDIDARSDVFSLGAILYQILTLQPPIRGDSVEEVLCKVRSGSFEAPTHCNPAEIRHRQKGVDEAAQTTLTRATSGKLNHCPGNRVPEALSAVTMRAMEFAPKNRYSSVSELMGDIVAYQQGFATSVQDIGALGQLWLLMKRHRVVSTLSALMLVLSSIFVFKLMASEERSRLNAEKARIEAGNADLAKHRAVQEAANAKEAEAVAKREKEATRIALAKARIALAEASYRTGDANALSRHLDECPEDLRDSNWRYLRDESDRQVRQIAALVNRSIWNCPPSREHRAALSPSTTAVSCGTRTPPPGWSTRSSELRSGVGCMLT
jgi:eukaryotic-like serine/threonine-protein kinase